MHKTIPIRRPTSGVEEVDSTKQSPADQPVDDEDDQVDNGPRPGLLFVAETGVNRPKGTLREIIRSQARRKRSNRTHSSTSKRPSAVPRASKHGDKETDSTSPDSTSPDSPSSDPRTVGYLTRGNGFPRPVSGPSAKAFDPFRTLPIEESGDFHFLFSQIELVFQPILHGFSCTIPKEAIISFAITDAALLHALAHSALSIANRGNSTNREMVYHGGQAIRYVNKSIANSPHEAVSDGTIMTVCCLISFETRHHSTKSIKIHMDGLEALVKSRGGIRALVDNPASAITMKFIYWADAVASIALDTKPRFELAALPSQQNPAHWEAYSHLALRYTTKLCNLTGLTELSQEIIDIYLGLRNLTALKDETFTAYKSPITLLEFNTYISRLVVSLVRIVHQDVPTSSNQNALIFRLFGNAALTHIVMFMRETYIHHFFSELLSSRIRTNVKEIDMPSFQLQYPEMMLWILIMGGFGSIGSIGTDNQWWFAKAVAEACLAQGIARTNEIAFFLSEFFWTDLYQYPMYTEFWDDVATAMKGGNKPVRMVDLTTSESPPASAE